MNESSSFIVTRNSMNTFKQASAETGSQDERLPPVAEIVLVQCRGFRCLGFLDEEDTWRDVFRHEELRHVESWEAF
jgi:hypothetical protein